MDSWGREKEPVSIQVSWPEGFLIGRLKNQSSPAINRIWINPTIMTARLKRGSRELMAEWLHLPGHSHPRDGS